MKDADDRLLESMLEMTPIEDDGFSRNIVRRLNRKLWVRRLALPIATAIGGSIALKPLTGLLMTAVHAVTLVFEDALMAASGSVPAFQTLILGAILLGAGLFSVRFVDE